MIINSLTVEQNHREWQSQEWQMPNFEIAKLMKTKRIVAAHHFGIKDYIYMNFSSETFSGRCSNCCHHCHQFTSFMEMRQPVCTDTSELYCLCHIPFVCSFHSCCCCCVFFLSRVISFLSVFFHLPFSQIYFEI